MAACALLVERSMRPSGGGSDIGKTDIVKTDCNDTPRHEHQERRKRRTHSPSRKDMESLMHVEAAKALVGASVLLASPWNQLAAP